MLPVKDGKVRAMYHGDDLTSMCNYEFMGWPLKDTGLTESPEGSGVMFGQLLLYLELPNPEAPNADMSYKTYSNKWCNQELAAAWLIAHWWEHALKICPCLHGENGDADPVVRRFRQDMIADLLRQYEIGIVCDVRTLPTLQARIADRQEWWAEA